VVTVDFCLGGGDVIFRFLLIRDEFKFSNPKCCRRLSDTAIPTSNEISSSIQTQDAEW